MVIAKDLSLPLKEFAPLQQPEEQILSETTTNSSNTTKQSTIYLTQNEVSTSTSTLFFNSTNLTELALSKSSKITYNLSFLFFNFCLFVLLN